MKLRLEEEKEYLQVENLTREAFWNVYRPGCSEHLVLHKLRKQPSFIKELDYVAAEGDKIVGAIAYSRMFYKGEMCKEVISFGPISVHPDSQKQGIGRRLIQETLVKAKELGAKAVLITGDTDYYHPLGFVSASNYQIYLPGMKEGEEAAFFMAKELEEGYLTKHPGTYTFDPCFEVNEQELEAFDERFPSKVKREIREGDLL